MKPIPTLCVPALALILGASLRADVSLPSIISDHMVLQKSAATRIWGKATPNEDITLTLGNATAMTHTGADGNWRATLNLQNSDPGPFELTIAGKNIIKISDVLVGEVWVASGQSNMEFELSKEKNAATEIPASANQQLRQFIVTRATSSTPLDDLKGTWMATSPEASGKFSAIAYYFGKTLQNEIHRPVAIINSSWGGTQIEAWISQEALDTVPDLKASSKRYQAQFEHYPGEKSAFVTAFEKWSKDTGHEDKPCPDMASFAGESVTTQDWKTVKLPGPVTGTGIPATGAVWLRSDVSVPPAEANSTLKLDYGVLNAFESVYWNGQLVRQYNYKTYPGTGFQRRFDIPASLVKAGRNVLAIRVVSPVTPITFLSAPKAGSINLSGPWFAKVEYSMTDLDAAQKSAAPAAPASPPFPQNVAAFLFNAMIHPILPFTIKGVIWYQGESNASRAWQYRTAFPLMISDWRKSWQSGDFPFYFCQLANFDARKSAPEESDWAELREAQTSVLALPHTGEAVLIDLGESGDIHPRNKRDAGERLARLALSRDYGSKVVDSGPVYESMHLQGGRILLKFSHTDGGLVAHLLPPVYDVKSASGQTAPLIRNSPQSQIEGFAICGKTHQWVWANARITGDTVEVWSDQISEPEAVRYAWANNPTANLYNGAGLPATPFRTDNFPAESRNRKY